MNSDIRDENEVFSELETLCTSPGYAHAIAYFCFRDNTIKYADKMEVEDVLQQYSMKRLLRTEISTLVGLALKGDFDTENPPPSVIQTYIDRTESLLQELHNSMMLPFMQSIDPEKINKENFNPLKNGSMLREAIFYGGEAAYHFQYKDLSFFKYQNDSDWFLKNKGYSLEQAHKIISTISDIQNDKINKFKSELIDKIPEEWSVLPSFTFSIDEISHTSGETNSVVSSFVNSFVIPNEIDKGIFSALDDFNPSNAYPIIKLNDGNFLLFQNHSLLEALYETPFFWLLNDPSYKDTARENRGAFTEGFSARRLKTVFGEGRVFTNVDIYKNKNRVTEIDVLVIFSNRAIVLQAKSKKLTIAARKGNDNCLKSDFKKAVQDAYNQAFKSAECLNDTNCQLIDSDGNEIKIDRSFQEIYPFCVVSDHYPSLSFQARQFLKYQETESIMPPFIMDVFFLDVMTEMLQSPLHFLSYVNRRVKYSERIMSGHELTILSYHLKQNLWINDESTMLHLGDDICADLDLAMLTRRAGAPGVDTPEGILTRYKDTHFDRLVNEIDQRDDPRTINLGFMLLTLSGDTIEQLNSGISQLIELYNRDGNHHDLTLGIGEGLTGLTIHCNSDDINISGPRLKDHCLRRKYTERANTWFGICINPNNRNTQFGVNFDSEWEKSSAMDEITKDLPKLQNLRSNKSINFKTKIRGRRKIGRNEKCLCGSGKKYKKCCL